MALTTFLSEHELNKPTTNSEINEVLAQIRKLTFEDWQVLEYINTRKVGITRRLEVSKTYVIYKYIGGMGPWQQICMYSGSFNDAHKNYEHYVKTNVCETIAFLYGLLAGLENKNVQHNKHVV